MGWNQSLSTPQAGLMNIVPREGRAPIPLTVVAALQVEPRPFFSDHVGGSSSWT